MLRIIAEKDGHPIVLLGLDDENYRRLGQDQPILVNLRHFDPNNPDIVSHLPEIEVCIFHAGEGEMEAVMRKFDVR